MREAALDRTTTVLSLVADDDALQHALRHLRLSLLRLRRASARDRLDARDVAADLAHARRVLELAGRRWKRRLNCSFFSFSSSSSSWSTVMVATSEAFILLHALSSLGDALRRSAS
jgi:hypothetical protein